MTTMREQRKAEMYRRIAAHGENLKTLFGLPGSVDSVELCKRLKRVESKAAYLALKGCNQGWDTEDEWELESGRILASVDKILGFKEKGIPVFVNGDPRGYALKIDAEWMAKHPLYGRFHTDWGGYGILAPGLSSR